MSKHVLVASPRSGALIDQLALSVVKKHQPEILTSPGKFDAQRFLECELENSLGISFDYAPLQPNIHGYTDIEEMTCVICSSFVDDPKHVRFLNSTIAHELGHCFLHVHDFRRRKLIGRFINDDDTANLKLYREETVPLYANPEWQAFRFAGALLIPKPSLELAISEGRDIKELCDTFEVHPAFLRSRLRALKLA